MTPPKTEFFLDLYYKKVYSILSFANKIFVKMSFFPH